MLASMMRKRAASVEMKWCCCGVFRGIGCVGGASSDWVSSADSSSAPSTVIRAERRAGVLSAGVLSSASSWSRRFVGSVGAFGASGERGMLMSRSVLGDVGYVGAPALCVRSAARTSVETVAPGAHEMKEAPSAHPAIMSVEKMAASRSAGVR